MRVYRSVLRHFLEEWVPDIEARQPVSMTVHEDDTPHDTGLLDERGNPIIAVNQIGPIGFNR